MLLNFDFEGNLTGFIDYSYLAGFRVGLLDSGTIRVWLRLTNTDICPLVGIPRYTVSTVQ
jgi:hypothetical protein